MEGQAFNAEAMATNIDQVEAMARRMRQNEAVGDGNDELFLCRMSSDLRFLVRIVEVQSNANAALQAQLTEANQEVAAEATEVPLA